MCRSIYTWHPRYSTAHPQNYVSSINVTRTICASGTLFAKMNLWLRPPRISRKVTLSFQIWHYRTICIRILQTTEIAIRSIIISISNRFTHRRRHEYCSNEHEHSKSESNAGQEFPLVIARTISLAALQMTTTCNKCTQPTHKSTTHRSENSTPPPRDRHQSDETP